MRGIVKAVHATADHQFSKEQQRAIRLIEGLGVEGDAHAGETVKHRSRVAKDPTQPNLRQVHLLPCELFAEVAAKGFEVTPGDLGENVTTEGLDLLGLPRGAQLKLGAFAVVEVTGLRNPCVQIERFQDGLLDAVLERGSDGALIRKAGIMGVVLKGGLVRPGDPIDVVLPPPPYQPLSVV